eukprot:2562136-Rhodomonas_salina.4
MGVLLSQKTSSGLRVQGLCLCERCGFAVCGLGVRVFRFRVQGLGFRVQGSGFRVQGSGFRGFGLWGLGFGV